jgi:hypothetical protein
VTLVGVVVGLLLAAGLVGAVVPFVPGTPLILAAAVVHAVATDFTPVGAGRLVILGALAAAGAVLSYAAGAVGARRAGGSRWAVAGALAGGVVGLAAAPVGLLLGPIVGAVLVEIVRTRRPAESLRVGVGTAVGLLAGAVAHAAVAVVMVALFLWWVWRG